MKNNCFDRLVILEMANNHMGDVAHGIKLIRALKEAVAGKNFRYAVKFQYRDLDTLIHPDFKERMDIKYIKRFSETRLPEEDFLTLKKEVENCGFIPLCTPFDEKSVDMVVKHGYSMIKIASCSFNDWPLLEKIAAAGKPVIASTAGAVLEDIDNVVSFFEHRNIPLCLMHCVGSYPTPDEDLEMNQIDFFRQRYPEISIGFSTHENPENFAPVMIAVAKGAVILERHTGLPTEKYAINGYSSTPEQISKWLDAAEMAYTMCGKSGIRRDIFAKEASDLRGLQRGIFAALPIKLFCIAEYLSQRDLNTYCSFLSSAIKKAATFPCWNLRRFFGCKIAQGTEILYCKSGIGNWMISGRVGASLYYK